MKPARLTAASAFCIALAITAAYFITRAPAPTIRVRWHADVTPERQLALERKYALVNRRSPNRSFAYDVLDTTRRNLRALVEDPAVADTNDVDRRAFTIDDDADAGEVERWIAHQLPGLRDARVRWALAVALAAIGLAALARSGLRLPRWRIRLPRVGSWLWAPGDLFDRLPTLQPEWGAAAVAGKVIALGLLLAAVGVPILRTFEALVLGAGLLAIVSGNVHRDWRRFAGAALLVIVVAGISSALPRADLAEAHNAFILQQPGEALERGLPREVFTSWKAQFHAFYPPDAGGPALDYDWRDPAHAPKSLYTWSSDALWRRPRYSRQVDAVQFQSLGDFRGGFANESDRDGVNRYNFWVGDLNRAEMPFYVMYELTRASVGSRLAWTGQVFWQRANGGFDELRHERFTARAISEQDVGRRVYAAFFPARGPFAFALQPSLPLRISAWLHDGLAVFAAVAVLALTIRPRWSSYARLVALAGFGYALLTWYLPAHPGYLGSGYAPHGGGDDGLVHDGWGRLMALRLREGDVAGALAGAERVYWFTPGTRYVRMVEKLVFGDTNLLFALIVASLPAALFLLVRHVGTARLAWAAVVAFVLNPIGNLSFLYYVNLARAGYGEAAGAALFFFGMLLLMRTQPAWGGASDRVLPVWLGGAALAGAMFIRPNFALAVAWLGAAYAWLSCCQGRWRNFAALAAGLGLALWMPAHNWYYGGELYLVSKSGLTVATPIGPGLYGAAALDAVAGRLQSAELTQAVAQLKGALFSGPFRAVGGESLASVAHAIRLSGLAAAVVLALRWGWGRLRGSPVPGVIAVAALAAHVPMLFVFATYDRYAVLGWDLSLLAAIAALAHIWRPVDGCRARERDEHSTYTVPARDGHLAVDHAR